MISKRNVFSQIPKQESFPRSKKYLKVTIHSQDDYMTLQTFQNERTGLDTNI